MFEPAVIQALVNAGPLGLLILYVINERKADKAAAADLEKKRVEAEIVRANADVKMAAALTALAIKITGSPHAPE